MPHFTFFMHDGPETVPSFHVEFFESLRDAVQHAERLLTGNAFYKTVEITDGATAILATIERPSPPAQRPRPGQTAGASA